MLTEGAYRFCLGLGKKIVIADNLAIVADAMFALPANELGVAQAWLGILCYSLQIYFDFSGYSDMAIGLGRLLGFHFPENFDQPYRSANVTEFWRRWHMTLSRWFRDYLYIPLGGNRHGSLRTFANLWIVFFLCGLWHGAGLTFVVWGLYHGLLLILERFAATRVQLAPVGLARHRPELRAGDDRLGFLPGPDPRRCVAISICDVLFRSGRVTSHPLAVYLTPDIQVLSRDRTVLCFRAVRKAVAAAFRSSADDDAAACVCRVASLDLFLAAAGRQQFQPLHLFPLLTISSRSVACPARRIGSGSTLSSRLESSA